MCPFRFVDKTKCIVTQVTFIKFQVTFAKFLSTADKEG